MVTRLSVSEASSGSSEERALSCGGGVGPASTRREGRERRARRASVEELEQWKENGSSLVEDSGYSACMSVAVIR